MLKIQKTPKIRLDVCCGSDFFFYQLQKKRKEKHIADLQVSVISVKF
jgi:ubiquinone/menaquinone biosynthesis C-methylase UbiE